MIIVDRALREREASANPITVAIVGAGFMGHAVARQLTGRTPGMRLVAVANRTINRARTVWEGAGVRDVAVASSRGALDDAVRSGRPVVTDDLLALSGAESVDVVIEATGTFEVGAQVVMAAIESRKRAVIVNAELDGTLGPILKRYADDAGVLYTNTDGDQPAAELNLYRFAKGIGATPLLCGNIKGLIDHYRTPDTQVAFASQWGLKPHMAASFADGSKISYEQAVVANATGMGVAQRNMRGFVYEGHVEDEAHLNLYDVDELRALGGIVDYVLGAQPGPGVFVLAAYDDDTDGTQRRLLDFYKMGKGPLYCLYTPFHLCHLEVPLTVGRAVLFRDAAAAPDAGLVVDVVAAAKRDLVVGEVIDGIGHYMTYGQCENADVAAEERLLPLGVAEGCTLRRDVPRDRVLTYDDVELPEGRLCDRLREEQQSLVLAKKRAGMEATA